MITSGAEGHLFVLTMLHQSAFATVWILDGILVSPCTGSGYKYELRWNLRSQCKGLQRYCYVVTLCVYI
jgi:hypothetical protein